MEVDPDTETANKFIALGAFTAYMAIISAIDYMILPFIKSHFSETIQLFAITAIDIVSFTLLYIVVSKLYDGPLFRLQFKVDNISGVWYQYHFPSNNEIIGVDSLDKIRFGTVNFKQRLFHVTSYGKNRSVDILVNTPEDAHRPKVGYKQYIESKVESLNRCDTVDAVNAWLSEAKVVAGDIDVHENTNGRFTVWNYLTAHAVRNKSQIYALFTAKSDKIDGKKIKLCEKCKDAIDQCEECKSKNVEIYEINQEQTKSGAHIIDMIDASRLNNGDEILDDSKKIFVMSGEYRNLLPNKSGMGKLYFFRVCKDNERLYWNGRHRKVVLSARYCSEVQQQLQSLSKDIYETSFTNKDASNVRFIVLDWNKNKDFQKNVAMFNAYYNLSRKICDVMNNELRDLSEKRIQDLTANSPSGAKPHSDS